MLESVIVGSLKSIYDMVMTVISAHDAQKRNLFVDHVEPLHARMVAIHKDYMAGSPSSSATLKPSHRHPARCSPSSKPGGATSKSNAIWPNSSLSASRAPNAAPVRPDAWAALKTYCEAIADYFYPASNIAHTTWYTRFLDKVRGQVERGHGDVWWDPSIAGDPRGDHAREQLLYMAIIALRDLPEAFRPINAGYADLKAKLL